MQQNNFNVHQYFNLITKNYIYFVFLVSFFGMFGSLYFSDVLLIDPCSLCYVQRLFLYPMVFLSLINIILKKEVIKPFVFLSLSLFGLITSIYHNYLQLVQVESLFCDIGGVSCSKVEPVYIFDVAFSIPFLSLIAFLFLVILIAIVMYRSRNKFILESNL